MMMLEHVLVLSLVLCCSLLAVRAQPDLTIKNSCSYGLWIEGRNGGGAVPGESSPVKYAAPGASVTYTIPDAGLSSTRWWAKYGCDSTGNNCLMGHQVPDPSDTSPPPYDPPLDSLFEATWGCKTCAGSTTWFDTSQVDGYTIPYRVLLAGDTRTCDGCTNPNGCNITIDATHLSLANCPSDEDISDLGAFSIYAHEDLRVIKNGLVLACASPCKHMQLPLDQFGVNLPETQWPVPWYCCPTPIANPTPTSCLTSAACFLSTTCQAGPIPNTKYVKTVHESSTGIYAYSYDDVQGLHSCPAGTVTYTMEYCPPGSAPYPYNPASTSATSLSSSSSSASGKGTSASSSLTPGSLFLCVTVLLAILFTCQN